MNKRFRPQALALVALAAASVLAACSAAPPFAPTVNGTPAPSPGGDVNPVSGTTAQGAKGQ